MVLGAFGVPGYFCEFPFVYVYIVHYFGLLVNTFILFLVNYLIKTKRTLSFKCPLYPVTVFLLLSDIIKGKCDFRPVLKFKV